MIRHEESSLENEYSKSQVLDQVSSQKSFEEVLFACVVTTVAQSDNLRVSDRVPEQSELGFLKWRVEILYGDEVLGSPLDERLGAVRRRFRTPVRRAGGKQTQQRERLCPEDFQQAVNLMEHKT